MGRCITTQRSVSWAYLLWHAEALVCAKSLQSCLTLCDPMNCSLPGSSAHGILQARMLEWVAISFSRGSSWPRSRTRVSCIAGRFFITELWGKWLLFLTEVDALLQCPVLPDPPVHLRWHFGVVPRLSCFGCGFEFSWISLPLGSPLFLPCPPALEGIALLC